MAFQDLAVKPGRQAATILELDLDSCENVYGTSPCAATLALTNIVRESQTFDVGATWAPFNAAVVASTAFAPDGTPTADDLRPADLLSSVKELTQPLNLTLLNLTDTFTASCYVQAGNGIDSIRLFIRTNAIDGAYVDVNVAEGVVLDFGDLGAGAPIQGAPLLQNAFAPPGTTGSLAGWFRVSLSFKFASLTVPQIRFGLLDASGNPVFAAASTAFGMRLWGAQISPGPTAGLYAPTTTLIVNGMGTSDDLCYNTFGTCQDTPNYVKEVKTFRFITELAVPIEASDAFNVLQNVSYAPTRLDPGAGMSARGTVQVELVDFQHNDIGGAQATSQNAVDKYVRLRSVDADDSGTFFGRLKARNEFYVGRPMRVLEGYLDEPFSLSNFRTREYVIEKIEGPDANGSVRIIGKDILSKTRNDRAKAPTPSEGSLLSAMTNVQTSATVGAGEGPAYDVDPNIRIDDEIMTITSRTGDVLTVTRATGGTTAAAHDAGAAVQSCLTYTDEPVIDVIFNLLTVFSGIPSGFIPFSDWEAEEAASLSGYDLTTIISEPTGVTQLLKEISDCTLIDLWYSDTDQEIKLKLQTPFTDVSESINDDDDIIADSMQVKDVLEKRLSRVLIYYDMRNFAENLTETANFRRANFEIEADKESANKFGDERVKVIFSRWFDSSNSVQVQLTSTRLLERFGNTPQLVTFELDAKDVERLQTGDAFDMRSRIIQATDGGDRLVRLQVIESRPKKPSTSYVYKALSFFVDPALSGPEVIAADETDFDLFVELGGPPGPIEVDVTINAGVTVRATKGNPAFTTGNLHPDSIVNLTNNGNIYGHSGNGGNGANALTFCSFEGEFGGVIYAFLQGPGDGGVLGGDALNVTISEISVDNTGTGQIFGGGGGGGGGGSEAGIINVYGGGGGGGGRGSDGVGCAGSGGTATASAFACTVPATFDGTDGSDGSEAGAGAGGVSADTTGDGGAGGDWGAQGTNGENNGGELGGPGGGAGNAVRLNGANIIWLDGNNPAQVKGAVS